MASRGGRTTAGKPGAGATDRKAEMIKRFDKDGDGQLSESEKKAAMSTRGGKPGASKPEVGKPGADGDRRAQMMKRFDTDGDGKISEAEKNKAMSARGGNARGARKPKK